MPASSTNPVVLRRVERAIRICTPLLDLLLAISDRVSRVLAPEDPDYAVPRMATDAEHAPRGLREPVAQTGARAQETELA